MKKKLLTSVILLFGTLSLLGQEENTRLVSENWGDYYFVNQNYEKAVNFYARFKDSIRIDTRRNWALALSAMNKKSEAKTQYAIVANSVEAQVEDYYVYAGLLYDEKQLAMEYRDKSFRLPWSKPSLFENDSLLFKKRFDQEAYSINSLKGNTKRSEFGMLFLTEEEKSTVFYLSEQDKSKASKKVLKRIKTDYPIYNFHEGVFDKTSFTLTEQEDISNSINSLFQEGPASFHEASGQLYFTRSADELDKKKTVQLNLYQIQLSDLNQNKTPTALPINVNEFSTMHPSVNAAGTELYFASDRPGGFGGMDLYRVNIEAGVFSLRHNPEFTIFVEWSLLEDDSIRCRCFVNQTECVHRDAASEHRELTEAAYFLLLGLLSNMESVSLDAYSKPAVPHFPSSGWSMRCRRK